MTEMKNNPLVPEENAAKIFSIKIGDDLELSFTLNAEGNPISADSQQEITDPVLVKAIKKRMEAEALQGDNLNDGVADSFKGLPMRELIGGPLFAAAEAQEKLASIALDYYNRIAFYGDGETLPQGKAVGDTRLLKFKVNRPVEQNGQMTAMEQTVEAPFIGLVPIPALLVERVDVDFQMEVTDTNTTKASESTELSSSVSAKWFTVQANISGKVSSSRENTRVTNQTAKYQVHVVASQQQPTEGLSKLMDIMASCIEPLPTSV